MKQSKIVNVLATMLSIQLIFLMGCLSIVSGRDASDQKIDSRTSAPENPKNEKPKMPATVFEGKWMSDCITDAVVGAASSRVVTIEMTGNNFRYTVSRFRDEYCKREEDSISADGDFEVQKRYSDEGWVVNFVTVLEDFRREYQSNINIDDESIRLDEIGPPLLPERFKNNRDQNIALYKFTEPSVLVNKEAFRTWSGGNRVTYWPDGSQFIRYEKCQFSILNSANNAVNWSYDMCSNEYYIYDLSLSADAKFLVMDIRHRYGKKNSKILVFDIANRSITKEIELEKDIFSGDVQFSDDGSKILFKLSKGINSDTNILPTPHIYYRGYAFYIYDLTTNIQTQISQVFSKNDNFDSFNEIGIIGGSGDWAILYDQQNLYRVNLKEDRIVYKISKKKYDQQIGFTPDGKDIFVARDNKVIFYDSNVGKKKRVISFRKRDFTEYNIERIAISRDQAVMVIVTSSYGVFIYDLQNNVELGFLEDSVDASSVSLNPLTNEIILGWKLGLISYHDRVSSGDCDIRGEWTRNFRDEYGQTYIGSVTIQRGVVDGQSNNFVIVNDPFLNDRIGEKFPSPKVRCWKGSLVFEPQYVWGNGRGPSKYLRKGFYVRTLAGLHANGTDETVLNVCYGHPVTGRCEVFSSMFKPK